MDQVDTQFKRPFPLKKWERAYLALWILIGIVHLGQSVVFSGGQNVPGGLGDGRLNNLILEHGYQSVVGSADFANPSQFHPVPGTIGHTDMHLGTLPFYIAPRIAGASPETAYQIWTLEIALLNLLCATLLLRRFALNTLTTGPLAVILAASSALVSFTGSHIQVLPVFPFFLCLIFLERITRSKRWIHWIALAASLSWLHLCSPYSGFFGTLAVSFILPFCIFGRDAEERVSESKRIRLATCVYFLVTVTGCLYMYSHYLGESESGTRPWSEVQALSPTIDAWFQTPSGNALYSNSLPIWDRINPSEFSLFSGFLVWFSPFLVFALTAILKNERRSSRFAFACSVAAVALVLFFTRFGDSGVFLWLAQKLDFLRAFRAVSRSVILIHLLQGVSFAFVVVYLLRNRSLRWLGYLACALALAETATFRQASLAKSVSSQRKDAVLQAWSKAGDKPVLALAPGHTNQSAELVHLDAWAAALASGRKTINGYSGRAPDGYLDFLQSPTESNLEALIDRMRLDPNQISLVKSWGQNEAKLGIKHLDRKAIPRLVDFEVQPIDWDLAYSTRTFEIDGKTYYLFHPPASFVFPVPPEARAFEITFGMHEQTYTKGGATDGVTLKWSLLYADQKVSIDSRHWNPLENPDDRGFHTLRFELPSSGMRRLQVEIEKGPGHSASDWALFSGLRFLSETQPEGEVEKD